MADIIQKQVQSLQDQQKPSAPKGINVMLNTILDGEKMRKRFDELLGERAAQFISSLVTVVNASPELQKCVIEDPMSVVQAGLKAATYDLPIESSLGYAWIVPRRNKVKLANGTNEKRWQASFQIGYKGLVQLALRTGAYDRIPNAVDVREGELKSYDRLSGDAEFEWIEDEDERESRPIIGYAAYFRLKNGAECYNYWTKRRIEKHELKFRPGEYMSKGWKDDYNAMACKTVLRDLISHKGLMSIEYRNSADASTMKLAQAVMEGNFSDDDMLPGRTIIPDYDVDEETGEVKEAGGDA